MIAWLRRLLLGEPCPTCALPVHPEDLPHHLAWHRREGTWRGQQPDVPPPTRPVRAARPHPRRNGGPT